LAIRPHQNSVAINTRQWKDLDSTQSLAELRKKLHGWTRELRIVFVRELLREKLSLGRRLLSVPGYKFRLFATSLPMTP
jgi:hypothetical protein